MVKDGINGYVVPKDMKFDVKNLLNIPKCPVYDNKAKEHWIKYLGNAIYEEKELRNMINIVRARLPFTDVEANIDRQVNEVWEIPEERAMSILSVNTPDGKLIEIIGVKENEDANKKSKTEDTSTVKQVKSTKKNTKQKSKEKQ